MKSLVRGVFLVAVAVGAGVALSAVAHADVVEPASAYQPASVRFVDEDAAAAAMPAAEEPKPDKADVAKKKKTKAEPAADLPAATPAPEQQVVRPASLPLVHEQAERAASASGRVVHPIRVGLEHIGASLGRVVNACQVGLATGPGGPVLVLAVLSMAIPFARRRISSIRRTADEDAPEFLYVWELTPPG